MVFHADGVRLGIGQDLAGGIDDSDARAGGLRFLSGDIGERVAAVGFDAVGEKLGFLDEVAFDLCAQGSLPGAADHDIENYGGGDDDDQKGRQQLEENPVCHFGSSKR